MKIHPIALTLAVFGVVHADQDTCIVADCSNSGGPDSNHLSIVEDILETFGEENCHLSERNDGASMTCSYEVPYWFSAYVEYNANPCSTNDPPYSPHEFIASYATPPGSSMEWIVFDTMCMSDNSIYSAIKSQWVNDDDAPPIPSDAPYFKPNTDAPVPDDSYAPCGNNPEGFGNGTKQYTCEKLAGLNRNKQKQKCAIPAIAENCPGLCSTKEECPCADSPYSFKLKKNKLMSCDDLEGFGKRKRERLCGKASVANNCRGVCGEECSSSD